MEEVPFSLIVIVCGEGDVKPMKERGVGVTSSFALE